MNPYQPDNFLQKQYDNCTLGSCLCSRNESCSWCSTSSSRANQRKEIVIYAQEQGYQLWHRFWADRKYYAFDMQHYISTNLLKKLPD